MERTAKAECSTGNSDKFEGSLKFIPLHDVGQITKLRDSRRTFQTSNVQNSDCDEFAELEDNLLRVVDVEGIWRMRGIKHYGR